MKIKENLNNYKKKTLLFLIKLTKQLNNSKINKLIKKAFIVKLIINKNNNKNFYNNRKKYRKTNNF